MFFVVYKGHYRSISELFWNGMVSQECRLRCLKQRLEMIQRVFGFDDCLRRDTNDPFSSIYTVWTAILNKFQTGCKSPQYTTIDEQLLEIHGKVKFPQYIPSKSRKYGTKIIWLVNNNTTYVLNEIIYIGDQTFSFEQFSRC